MKQTLSDNDLIPIIQRLRGKGVLPASIVSMVTQLSRRPLSEIQVLVDNNENTIVNAEKPAAKRMTRAELLADDFKGE